MELSNIRTGFVVLLALTAQCGYGGLAEAIAQAAVVSAVKTVAQMADESPNGEATGRGTAEALRADRTVPAASAVPAQTVEREWTSETIQQDPLKFLQDQIASCDRLKARIESYNITLVRMEKRATRAVEESEMTRVRYEKFLRDAKAAYKEAKGKWPVSVNGFDLSEDELNDKIADAMERIELAQKEHKDNAAIAKKVSIRKGVLKTKKRELVSLRMKLSQQAEAVKMNTTLAELGDLKSSLNAIKDLMIEVEEDPTKLSLEDLTETDPNAERNKKVQGFLNN